MTTKPRSQAPRLALLLITVLPLAACGSARFGGPGVQARAPAPVRPAPELVEPVEAAPAGTVAVEALPPVGGPAQPLPGPVVEASPPPVPQIEAPQPALPPPQPAAVGGGGRSALVGGWNARDAGGASCRVQLSSTPALDLYRASAGACANRDLARVNAWDLREGEVFLYQPGGAVAARLRPSAGGLDGVLAKSGAPLTLAR